MKSLFDTIVFNFTLMCKITRRIICKETYNHIFKNSNDR